MIYIDKNKAQNDTELHQKAQNGTEWQRLAKNGKKQEQNGIK